MTNHLVATTIDNALELAIVPSFSSVGPLVRGHIYDWPGQPLRSLTGRTALVTGPTSGIGKATAVALAGAGARLVLVGRSPERLAALARELPGAGSAHHLVVRADLSSLASVAAAVDETQASVDRLDVLVDNAGAIYPERTETAEGIESSLATLVCGPFALIRGLLPQLRAANGARVISVTSGGMYAERVHLDDLEWQARPYNGTRAYGQAKRIQVALTREWARRYANGSISFNAMHPGWVDTPGLADSLPAFYRVMKPILRSVDEGADTITWLARTPVLPAPGGKLYLDRRPRPFDRAPQTRLNLDDRVELWNLISELSSR